MQPLSRDQINRKLQNWEREINADKTGALGNALIHDIREKSYHLPHNYIFNALGPHDAEIKNLYEGDNSCTDSDTFGQFWATFVSPRAKIIQELIKREKRLKATKTSEYDWLQALKQANDSLGKSQAINNAISGHVGIRGIYSNPNCTCPETNGAFWIGFLANH